MRNRRSSWYQMGITAKILIVFLALSMISLSIIGSMAFFAIVDIGDYALDSSISLGDRAVNDSMAALEGDAEKYLLRLAGDQAAISNTLFEKVEAETGVMAKFASTLMKDPSAFKGRPCYFQKDKPVDKYSCSVNLLAPGSSLESTREELQLLSNMDDIFIPIFSADPHLTIVYVGTESGIVRIYPWGSGIDAYYDPRDRGWYKKAKDAGRLTWTEPYVDAFGHGLMVTCCRPIAISNGDYYWVVASDVTIETINQGIINTQIGQQGYALLVDEKGNVIARPGLTAGDRKWDDSFETENLLKSNNTELKAIGENMTEGKTGVARCSFEEGEKFIAYAPVKCVNWSVGVIMPVEEVVAPALTTKGKIASASMDTTNHINNQIDNIKNIFILVFMLLFFVVSGLSLFFSRVITSPVMELKKGSEALGKGDLDYHVEVKTGDEFEELAESFNKMAVDLKDHIDELRRTTAEKERMHKELEIARGIQQSFLPEASPQVDGMDLAAFNLPALEIGGDFYDFIPLSKDRWGLVIADVSGKGVPAALFMALSRTLIRASTAINPTALEAIKQANRLICEDSKTAMFVTLFYAILDAKKRMLTYVNAGHNPPILLSGGSSQIILLKARGIALGVVDDADLESAEIGLKSGDILVLYTDGVTEAINERVEEFGLERMESLIRENRMLSAEEIIKRIKDEVTAFSGTQPQYDDITLMVLKAR